MQDINFGFTKPFILEIDANVIGLGVVLSYNGRPLTYFGKVLCPRYIGLSIHGKTIWLFS
jgi:hypothetical protein